MIDSNTLRLVAEISSNVGPDVDLRSSLGRYAAVLPDSHLDLLGAVNGLTAFHGAFRLFGARTEPELSLTHWNEDKTWRFAWPEQLAPFLFFGETGWGDQYAYRLDESGKRESADVYFLEGITMRPRRIAESFDEFVKSELLRNATEPYDTMTVEAVKRNGALRLEDHWVLSPSIAFGASEDIDNLITLPAVTALIFAGDITSALRGSRPGTVPTRVEPWRDEVGRDRLRVEVQ